MPKTIPNPDISSAYTNIHNNSSPQPACKNIFKDGSNITTKTKFTQAWADLINQLEKNCRKPIPASSITQKELRP